MRKLEFFKQHLAHNKWAVLVFTMVAIVASVWTILAQTTSMDKDTLSHLFGTMVYGFSMCGIALMAVAVLPQSIRRETRMLAYLLALLLPILNTIWFYFSGWECFNIGREGSVFFDYILPWLCLLLVVPTLPFVKQRDDLHMQTFVARWALLTMLTSWVVGAVGALLDGLLVGTFTLFSLEFIDWLFVLVAIWSAWLGVVATLGMMPDPEQPGEAQWAVKLGKRVFLPVLLVYVGVLLVYLAKIIFMWELPNGTVTYMVSAMMIQLVAVWFLAYPSLRQSDKKWQKRLHYLPLICLPLVVLMSIGLYRRFSDYGITISRVYAVALNVWFYLLILVLTWRTRQGKPLTLMLTSLAIGLVVLTSIPYINARDYTHRHIVRDLDALMTDSVSGEVIQFDQFSSLDEWLQALPKEQGEALASKWNYMLTTFGGDDLPRWVADTASAQYHFGSSRLTYCYLTYNGGLDSLQTQVLLNYESGYWSNYPVPEGEWSSVFTNVWILGAEIQEDSENPSELIIPIRYRDSKGDERVDTIRLNWREPISSNGLCFLTDKGNAVSFQQLKIYHKLRINEYSTSARAILFVK